MSKIIEQIESAEKWLIQENEYYSQLKQDLDTFKIKFESIRGTNPNATGVKKIKRDIRHLWRAERKFNYNVGAVENYLKKLEKKFKDKTKTKTITSSLRNLSVGTKVLIAESSKHDSKLSTHFKEMKRALKNGNLEEVEISISEIEKVIILSKKWIPELSSELLKIKKIEEDKPKNNEEITRLNYDLGAALESAEEGILEKAILKSARFHADKLGIDITAKVEQIKKLANSNVQKYIGRLLNDTESSAKKGNLNTNEKITIVEKLAKKHNIDISSRIEKIKEQFMQKQPSLLRNNLDLAMIYAKDGKIKEVEENTTNAQKIAKILSKDITKDLKQINNILTKNISKGIEWYLRLATRALEEKDTYYGNHYIELLLETYKKYLSYSDLENTKRIKKGLENIRDETEHLSMEDYLAKEKEKEEKKEREKKEREEREEKLKRLVSANAGGGLSVVDDSEHSGRLSKATAEGRLSIKKKKKRKTT